MQCENYELALGFHVRAENLEEFSPIKAGVTVRILKYDKKINTLF